MDSVFGDGAEQLANYAFLGGALLSCIVFMASKARRSFAGGGCSGCGAAGSCSTKERC